MMTISDKIVTLSYGPFTCSLQEFEETFDILGPIAKYFRDLWADENQNKGALPSPDVDELARIVSAAISQPVEGYLAKGTIILTPVKDTGTSEVVAETDENEADTVTPVDKQAETSASKPTVDDAADEVAVADETADEPEKVKATESENSLQEDLKQDVADIDASANQEDVAPNEDVQPEEAPAEEVDDIPVESLRVSDSSAKEASAEKSSQTVSSDETPTDERADDNVEAETDTKPPVRPSRIGRVIKMKRQDFEDAIGGKVVEDVTPTPAPNARRRTERPQATAKPNVAIEAPEESITPAKPKPVGRRRGADRLASSERRSDVDRIFNEANSQMGTAGSSQNRSAIHHLRAAVAATRAEKSAGHDLNLHTDETPYRSDLAEAVEAPDCADNTSRPRRKNTSTLAPLRLVADQRIDTDKR